MDSLKLLCSLNGQIQLSVAKVFCQCFPSWIDYPLIMAMELWYIFITNYLVYQYGFGPFSLLLYFLLLSFILLLRDILVLSLPCVLSDSLIFFCFFCVCVFGALQLLLLLKSKKHRDCLTSQFNGELPEALLASLPGFLVEWLQDQVIGRGLVH